MRPRPADSDNSFVLLCMLWGSQALVHQGFFSGWLQNGDAVGWLVTARALGNVLWPGRPTLVAALARGSALKSLNTMPFLPNHIFVELLPNGVR